MLLSYYLDRFSKILDVIPADAEPMAANMARQSLSKAFISGLHNKSDHSCLVPWFYLAPFGEWHRYSICPAVVGLPEQSAQDGVHAHFPEQLRSSSQVLGPARCKGNGFSS